jgi:hypothetical protein
MVEHIDTLLQLMSDFGSGWTVLYNGPKCGASAPDHLHFQASPSGQMPIEKEIRGKKKRILITQTDGVSLYRVRDVGREVILLEGDNPMAVGKLFKGFLDALGEALLVSEEPMINVPVPQGKEIFSYHDGNSSDAFSLKDACNRSARSDRYGGIHHSCGKIFVG